MTGQVYRWLQATPETIHLDDVSREGSRSILVESITVRNFIPIRAFQARCDTKFGAVRVQRLSEDAHLVEATLTVPERAGRFEIPITIEAISSANTILRTTVMIEGTVVELVESHPRLMNLGAVLVGRVAEGFVTIRSRDGRAYHVRKIECDDAFTSFVTGSSSPTEAEFQIRQQVVEVGETARTVRFHVETEDGLTIVHELPVRCHGIGVATRAGSRESP